MSLATKPDEFGVTLIFFKSPRTPRAVPTDPAGTCFFRSLYSRTIEPVRASTKYCRMSRAEAARSRQVRTKRSSIGRMTSSGCRAAPRDTSGALFDDGANGVLVDRRRRLSRDLRVDRAERRYQQAVLQLPGDVRTPTPAPLCGTGRRARGSAPPPADRPGFGGCAVHRRAASARFEHPTRAAARSSGVRLTRLSLEVCASATQRRDSHHEQPGTAPEQSGGRDRRAH